jgi:DNA-binding response OmpR family regulator
MREYTVLVIDDDIWIQRIFAKTLESYGFNNIILASDGFEGIALAVEHRPLLIIMDILMPELSGHLCLKILKSIKITKNTPVLMVSALSDAENLGLAVKTGSAGFISKPFTRATVYDKLISVFSREKIDKIMKGEDVEFDRDYTDEEYQEDSFSSNYNNKTESMQPKLSSDKKQSQESHKDPTLKTYKDDEKRSIESIKKLLLKTRRD